MSKVIVVQQQSSLAADTTLHHNRPKLSMIWVKESDGTRQRLVARWVTQD